MFAHTYVRSSVQHILCNRNVFTDFTPCSHSILAMKPPAKNPHPLAPYKKSPPPCTLQEIPTPLPPTRNPHPLAPYKKSPPPCTLQEIPTPLHPTRNPHPLAPYKKSPPPCTLQEIPTPLHPTRNPHPLAPQTPLLQSHTTSTLSPSSLIVLSPGQPD